MTSADADWFRVVSAPPAAEPPCPGALAWLWCRFCGTWFLPIEDDDELTDLLAVVYDHQTDCDPEPPDSGTRVIIEPSGIEDPPAGGTVGS